MVRCFRKGVNFFGITSRPARGSLVRKHRKTETLQDKSGYLTKRVSSDRGPRRGDNFTLRIRIRDLHRFV